MTKKRLEYRWIIAITCFVMFFFFLGMGNSPNSLYIVPVTEFFNFTRGDFSLVLTIIMGVSLIVQMFLGILVQRFGIRLVVCVGALMVPVGFFVFSKASTLAMFYTGAAIVGTGMAFASITSVSILINSWFKEKQGTILGLTAAGTGFGGAIFTILIGNYIETKGFQAAYLLTAIVLAVTALPVIIFIRANPDDDSTNGKGKASSAASVEDQSASRKSTGNILNQPFIWVSLVAVFLLGFAIHAVMISTPAYLIDKGFDSVFAAKISGFVWLVVACGKIGMGYLNDKLGIRISLAIGLISSLISTILLILADVPWMVWIFVIFDGIAIPSEMVLVPLFAKNLLGEGNFNRYVGVFNAILSAGMSSGLPVVNYSFDLSGTYTHIMIILAGINLVSLALINVSLNMKARKAVEVEAA